MSRWFALTGWVVGVAGGLMALGERRRLAARADQVARACHEVRGPLAAARLGLSAGGRLGRLESARLRALDHELERATRAIEDLEGVQRPRRLEAVDVRALLADCAAAWQAPAASSASSLSFTWSGTEAVVWGDRVRLAQAVENLIANAIEHGRAPVEVRGRLGRAGVRIEVTDCGAGLQASIAELLRRKRQGRRGHGLEIASSVAAAHGGRLSSAPSDSGARLVLTLPATAAASAARAWK